MKPLLITKTFEAVDRAFRDIMHFSDPNSVERIFGRKKVLVGGGIRHILSIVIKGRTADIITFSINKSYIWQPIVVQSFGSINRFTFATKTTF